MFDFPFLIWRDEWLILPMVRQAVSKLAACAAWLSIIMAVTALIELLLLVSGVPLGVVFGFISHLCGVLLLVSGVLLLPWCLVVLTAHRGGQITRTLALFAALFAVLHALCEALLWVGGISLLPQQGVLPLLLVFVSVCVIFLNWGNLEAASPVLRVRLMGGFLFYLFALISDTPDVFMLGAVFKIACCWAVFRPLRCLSDMAVRVIGLPPVEEEETAPEQPDEMKRQ